MSARDLLFDTGAEFSPCRRWRTRLWRVWDATLRRAVFCMMNPSDANEVENDATVERQQRRVMKWNEIGLGPFGGAEVVNAFSWVEKDSLMLPKRIAEGIDIIGPGNDQAILDAAFGAGIFICGWGKPGALLNRGAAVLELLRNASIKPYALKINADGSPQHPLYIGYDVMPVPMLGAA